MKPPDVCIVIPAANEERTIAATIREYKVAFPLATFVVVDNNSSDILTGSVTSWETVF
jgi:glycosyltransferase involved in cell wall biosynthesis